MRFLLIIFLFLIAFSSSAQALPGDYDMYRQQSLKANEVARSPVKGTVPRGHTPFLLTVEEAAKTLNNPVPKTLKSVWRGRRLWNANCAACHGKTADGKGPVGPLLSVPSLLSDYYSSSPDGRSFAVIQLGQRNMPRQGFKLSDKEKWDVINYLRFLQGKVKVSEIKKPGKEGK